jgi:uncharacterized protein YuzE
MGNTLESCLKEIDEHKHLTVKEKEAIWAKYDKDSNGELDDKEIMHLCLDILKLKRKKAADNLHHLELTAKPDGKVFMGRAGYQESSSPGKKQQRVDDPIFHAHRLIDLYDEKIVQFSKDEIIQQVKSMLDVNKDGKVVKMEFFDQCERLFSDKDIEECIRQAEAAITSSFAYAVKAAVTSIKSKKKEVESDSDEEAGEAPSASQKSSEAKDDADEIPSVRQPSSVANSVAAPPLDESHLIATPFSSQNAHPVVPVEHDPTEEEKLQRIKKAEELAQALSPVAVDDEGAN